MPQPESFGVAPQPDVDVSPAAIVENVPEPAGDSPACYAYRHSWRRRKVPVVAGGDGAPATEARAVPSTRGAGINVAAPAVENSLEDADDLPPLVEVDDSSSSSSTALTAVAADTATLYSMNALGSSKEDAAVTVSPDAPELEPGYLHLSAQEFVDTIQPSIRDGWHERQQRRGRGGRYAAIMAAVQPR